MKKKRASAGSGVVVPMAAWNEWRALCSMDKCSPEHQRLLAEFGDRSLRKCYGTWSSKVPWLPSDIPFMNQTLPGQGFREMEIYLLLAVGGIAGFKHHLFEVAAKKNDNPAYGIKNYLYTMMLRSVIRRALCELGLWSESNSFAQGPTSVDEPEDDDTPYRRDQLELQMLNVLARNQYLSEGDKIAFRQDAQELAPEYLAVLKENELVCLAWKLFGLPLTHSQIKEITGFQRQRVHELQKAALAKMKSLVLKKAPEIEDDQRLMLMCYLVLHLRDHIQSSCASGSALERIVDLSEQMEVE